MLGWRWVYGATTHLPIRTEGGGSKHVFLYDFDAFLEVYEAFVG